MSKNHKKTIFIIGARGTIGKLLKEGLSGDYEVLLSDTSSLGSLPDNYQDVDIRDLDCLFSNIPEKFDVLINLAGVPPAKSLPVDDYELSVLSDIYIRGSYNVFLAAHRLKIPRVIFASTNQVTGTYESGGTSRLNRPISTKDSPDPDSVYGAMKYCAESFGYLFATQKGLSVISLRIGTVYDNETALLIRKERARRTILSHKDTVSLFRSAIETKLLYGVFYGVSDNPGRPWKIEDTIHELGFIPEINSNDLLAAKE